MSNADKSKEMRKFTMTTLKGFGFGKIDMEARILEEISELVHALEDEKGQPMDPRQLLQPSVSNVICFLVFGKRFNYDDPKFKDLLNWLHEIVTDFNSVVNIIPWLRFLPGDFFNLCRLNKNLKNISRYYQDVIQTRMAANGTDINDFVDALIHEMKGRTGLDTIDSKLTKIFL